MPNDGDAVHYNDMIVWDSHTCLPLLPGLDMSPLDRHRAAGATFVHVNVGMDYTPLDLIMRMIAGCREWLARQSNHFLLASSVADIERAKREGKLAVAFDLEGSIMLQDDMAMLRLFRDLGVRQMHLAYNRANSNSGGCFGEDRGLSEPGREMVRRINELGILMDCSHMGERSTLDVMTISEKPVIFSHANVRALCNHPRNLTDAQIDACAATDGVVGICGIGPFLGSNDITTESLLCHIDYIAERVGARHVGLGLDYVFDQSHSDLPEEEDHDYWYPPTPGFNLKTMRIKPPEDLPDIAAGLVARGYSRADVCGIMGANFQRVAAVTWPEI